MILLSRAVAHPWLCDIMGHLTTRHYVAMFDDATYALAAAVTGWRADDPAFAGTGWADIRHEIDYRDEIAAGTVVEISGTARRMGTSSIDYALEMVKLGADTPAASMVIRTVFFDLAARKARPLSEPMRERPRQTCRL